MRLATSNERHARRLCLLRIVESQVAETYRQLQLTPSQAVPFTEIDRDLRELVARSQALFSTVYRAAHPVPVLLGPDGLPLVPVPRPVTPDRCSDDVPVTPDRDEVPVTPDRYSDHEQRDAKRRCDGAS